VSTFYHAKLSIWGNTGLKLEQFLQFAYCHALGRFNCKRLRGGDIALIYQIEVHLRSRYYKDINRVKTGAVFTFSHCNLNKTTTGYSVRLPQHHALTPERATSLCAIVLRYTKLFDNELGGTGLHETRTLKRGHKLAHVAPPGTDYPFTCPACDEEVTEAADPPDTKSAGLKHRNTHKGQNKGCEPIFNIPPILMVMCALHALLAVAGSVFKIGIGNHLTSQVQCSLIDEYLHTECNTAYKCKRVKLSESQSSALKRPSFDGRSAGEVISSMRTIVQLKDLGGEPQAPTTST
jgi:hypothetical protein